MSEIYEGGNSQTKSNKHEINRSISNKPLALMFMSLFVALVAWAFASPIGASPDEDFHLVSIWCGQGTRDGLCTINEGESVTVSETLVLNSSCYAHFPDVSAGCSHFDDSVMIETLRSNADKSYPPLFYWFMALFASPNIGLSVLVMRIVNALIFTGLLLATYLLTKKKFSTPLIWGYFASIVPLGMFLIPSVNPSSWALISIGILWVSLSSYFRAERRINQIGLLLVATLATLIGSGARSDAAVYAVMAILAACLLSLRQIRLKKVLLIPVVLLVMISIMLFLSGGQSSVASDSLTSTHGSSSGTAALIAMNLVLLPYLWIGVFGNWGLGWLDTLMPGSVWVTAFGIYISLIFWGISKLTKGKSLALLMAFAALIAIPLYVLVSSEEHVGVGVQPRYIFPIMVLLIGIALVMKSGSNIRFNLAQTSLVVAGLSIANSFALHTNLRRYLTGTDRNQANLDSGIEWWWNIPFGPMWVWIAGSLFFAVTLFIAAKLIYLNPDSARGKLGFSKDKENTKEGSSS